MMLAPMMLVMLLASILAFLALVDARSNACEGSYTPDLESSEVWVASLTVDLGLSTFAPIESVDMDGNIAAAEIRMTRVRRAIPIVRVKATSDRSLVSDIVLAFAASLACFLLAVGPLN